MVAGSAIDTAARRKLVESSERWPETRSSGQEPKDIASEEVKQIATIAVAVAVPEGVWNLDRISTFHRLIRVTAWIHRFIGRTLSKRTPESPSYKNAARQLVKFQTGNEFKSIAIMCLSADEIQKAETTIFRQMQRDRFPGLGDKLAAKQVIEGYKYLTPFRPTWDEQR